MIGQTIKNTIAEIADGYGWEIITHGLETDHYHILICVQPRFAPSKVVELLKSNSARIVFRKFPDVKNRLWGGEFCTDGYCITTVGKALNTEQVNRYIEKQDMTIQF